MVNKNLICITKKKKNNDNYVICFNKSKKSNKTNKSKKVKKPKKDKKTNKVKEDKYLKLIDKAKSKKITKKEQKQLDKELFKKYCKCLRTLKQSKNKKMYNAKYGICMNSIYKNRGFKPPFNASKNC